MPRRPGSTGYAWGTYTGAGPATGPVRRPRGAWLLQAERRVVVHPVVRLDEHVGEVRAAVDQRLGVDLRQDRRLLHHLLVDLAGVGVAGRRVVCRGHLAEIAVDQRV